MISIMAFAAAFLCRSLRCLLDAIINLYGLLSRVRLRQAQLPRRGNYRQFSAPT